MINTTTWSPDTCGCVFEYQWDTDVPPAQRTHNFSRVLKTCSVHVSGLPQEKYDAVLEENQRKNKAFGLIATQDVDFAIVDEKGNKAPNTEKLTYSFDAQRNLIITAAGIKLASKESLTQALNSQFANKKVTIA